MQAHKHTHSNDRANNEKPKTQLAEMPLTIVTIIIFM